MNAVEFTIFYFYIIPLIISVWFCKINKDHEILWAALTPFANIFLTGAAIGTVGEVLFNKLKDWVRK